MAIDDASLTSQTHFFGNTDINTRNIVSDHDNSCFRDESNISNANLSPDETTDMTIISDEATDRAIISDQHIISDMDANSS